ncbi:hypothetical protein CR513_39951, partial [Mucuna pruriens]
MTRSKSSGSLHLFDPEIDKTLNWVKKSKNIYVGHSSGSFSSISESDNFEIKLDIADNPLYELEPMENNNRTFKELATPDPAQSYKLKFRLIHLLPKFHSLAGEDPHKHLKEFHATARDLGRLYKDESIFVLSQWSNKGLVVSAAGHVQQMGRHEADVPRKQHSRETLHEYWERFNKWCATCPYHQISEQLLLHLSMDRNMVNAASGGALMDKTLTAARHLILNMVSNTQQFGIREGVGTDESQFIHLLDT